MSDETTTPPATPPADDTNTPPAWLGPRLARERAAVLSAALADLGVDAGKDPQAAWQAWRDTQSKQAASVSDLAAKAAEAETLNGIFAPDDMSELKEIVFGGKCETPGGGRYIFVPDMPERYMADLLKHKKFTRKIFISDRKELEIVAGGSILFCNSGSDERVLGTTHWVARVFFDDDTKCIDVGLDRFRAIVGRDGEINKLMFWCEFFCVYLFDET